MVLVRAREGHQVFLVRAADVAQDLTIVHEKEHTKAME
jgi:hypothetical protein